MVGVTAAKTSRASSLIESSRSDGSGAGRFELARLGQLLHASSMGFGAIAAGIVGFLLLLTMARHKSAAKTKLVKMFAPGTGWLLPAITSGHREQPGPSGCRRTT